MSLFGAIGKLVGKATHIAAPLVGEAIGAGKGLVARLGRRGAKNILRAGAGAAGAVGRYARSHPGQAAVAGGAIAAGTAGAIYAHSRGKGSVMLDSSGQPISGGRSYRRMNPGNTRAMRRAIRRIESGAKLYSRFFHMHHGGIKHAPGVRLKHHRRRAA